MTLLFMDSWDHYTTITQKWASTGGGGGSISAGNGRWGTAAALVANLDGGFVSKPFAPKASFVVGVAWKYAASFASSSEFNLITFFDGTTAQVTLAVTSTKGLKVKNGSGTVLGTGSLTTLVVDTWYYFEFKVSIHNTTGTVSVRVNGVAETGLTGLTGLNTRQSANNQADILKLMVVTGGSAGSSYFDDLYLCDLLGSTNNDFLGDCRVEALLPNGNGNTSNLVGNDGNSTDNYLLVDEAAPSTADYVESSTVTDKDTYAYGNMTSTAGTVYGVQVLPYAAKTDAGTRSIASIARLSSTEVDSADSALSASPLYLPDIRETKPGGGAWAISDVNSAEFGVKVTA